MLIFIGLESGELSAARVMQRTEEGGRDVPMRRSRPLSARIGESCEGLPSVDHAFLFENSSADEPYRFVAEMRAGRILKRRAARPR